MKRTTILGQAALALAVVGLCLPQAAWSAPPATTNQETVADVRLSENGTLSGRVVTADFTVVPDAAVALCRGETVLAQAKADQNGRFRFTGLTSGVYRLATAQSDGLYRVWATQTAPPAAQLDAVIVVDAVRGQRAMCRFRDLMANPLFVTALIATAVAVPVAIHNSKKDASN